MKKQANYKRFLLTYWLLPAFIGLFSFTGSVHSQVSIGSYNHEAVEPQDFSVLELISNTGGLRLPRLTTAERDSLQATPSFQAEISAKAVGLMIFNTTSNCINTWNGNQWIDLCAPVRVTGIAFDKSAVQLFLPNGYTWATPLADAVVATVSPSDASDKRVIWSSSDPAVAVVGQGGIVTAIGNGQAVITSTTTDGGYTATCTVTVGCGAATVDGGWLVFMCHNLDADQSLDPFTYVEGDAAGENGTLGHLYQWGRRSDGHEKRNSLTTITQATNNEATTPADVVGKFTIVNSDWRNPQENILWGDGTMALNPAKAANDPCPAGWKVPSQTQWASIYTSFTTPNTWTWAGDGYKVGDSLYLPAAGGRNYSSGSLNDAGRYGYYWCNTVDSARSYYLFLSNSNVVSANSNYRTYGFSVRCVSE